jgi:predicted RNase H-like nuclease (RuvC/YqgF family)
MNAFKTLAEARSAFEALEAETVELRGKANEIPQIIAQLADAKAFLAHATTQNENFQLLIVQKDTEITAKAGEIEVLKTGYDELRAQLSELEKGQKTAKQHARELVAATGGAPVSVDQSEINKMQAGSEAEMAKAMLAEHDPVRLGQLYEEYNRLYRKPKNKK